MLRQVRTEFERERVLNHLNEHKRAAELVTSAELRDAFRFDFHHVPSVNGGASHKLIHVVRLGRGETDAAKALGYTVVQVRQSAPETDVTAVVNDTNPDLDSGEGPYEQEVLAGVGIALVPISRTVELAARIRRDCGIA
jgi:hypothetical protein